MENGIIRSFFKCLSDYINTMDILEQLASYYDLLIALIVFIISIIIAKAVDLIIEKVDEKLAKRTNSILDDLVLKAIRRPLFLAIILGGLLVSLYFVSALSLYFSEITNWFVILFIILGAYAATKLLNALLEWYATEMAHKTKTRVDKDFLPIFKKIGYVFVYAIAFMWILNQLGIEITPLIASLGIAGLAVALALQETLSNFFAGAHIVLDRPIKVGDYIELDSGDQGYVEEIGWRSTKIRTLPENLIIIPNAQLAQSKIVNYFGPKAEMNFIIPVGVSYDSDLEKVEKITMQIARNIMKKVPGGVPDFEPLFRYTEFGDSNINFRVILRAERFPDKYIITHEFIKQLKKAYDREKIEIAFPCRNIYMRK